MSTNQSVWTTKATKWTPGFDEEPWDFELFRWNSPISRHCSPFFTHLENGPLKIGKTWPKVRKSTVTSMGMKSTNGDDWLAMLHDSPPQLSQPRVLLLNCTCFSDASAWDFCSQSTPHPVLIHTYFGCSTTTSCWIIMIPNSNFCKENEPQKQKLDLNIFSINICQCHEIQQLNTFHAIQQKNNPS